MTTSPGMLSGRILGGTYKVTRLLGEGGMGTVFEAVNVRINKSFAVKVLHRGVSPNREMLLRFRREAQIATDLGHPHIVEVVDFNETEDGISYMVMEYLRGEDLAARLQRSPFMPLEKALRFTQQICSALHAAHRHGIVHRDLKPGNVFLCKEEEMDDFVKVLDFGLSKILGSTTIQTQGQMPMGTPHYMAPEQVTASHDQIGPWTDVFAMGAILYQMVAGKPAFKADSALALMYQIVHNDPPAPKTLRNLVPHELSSVIQRAISKNPRDRFASMNDLSRAATEALQAEEYDEPVSAVREAHPSSWSWGEAPSVLYSTKEGPFSTLSAAAAESLGIQQPNNPRTWRIKVISGLLLVAIALLVVLLIQQRGQKTPSTPQAAGQPPAQPAVAQAMDMGSVDAAQPDSVPTALSPPDVARRRRGRRARAKRRAPVVVKDAAVQRAPVLPAIDARPRVRKGDLLITSDGIGYRVFLDDKPVGRTPLKLTNIAAGFHRIKVICSEDRVRREKIEVKPDRLSKNRFPCKY